MTDNYCMMCNCKFNCKEEHKSSKKMKEYSKYLGFCGEKCINKLDPKMRGKVLGMGFMEGNQISLIKKIKWYLNKYASFLPSVSSMNLSAFK